MPFNCVLLLLTIVFRTVSSFCDESSHRVICDTLSDIQQYDTNKWTDLRIGDPKILNEAPFHAADDTLFGSFRNLHTLTIVNEIMTITINGTYAWLDYLNIFGNNLDYININLFEHFPDLRKVSLRKNRIKNVYNSYQGSTLKIIDLSENKLETIFPTAFSNSSIRWLSMRHNNLSIIGPGAFPTTLLVLNLDYNKIYNFEQDMLQTGNQLQELTISHNQMVIIPKLENLPQIKLLDFSYNQISQISDVFSALSKLNYLDLSYNKIAKIDNNFRYGPNQYYNIRISLAFNRLVDLDYYAITAFFGHKEIDPRTNNTISIYGNPFCCNCLSQMHRYFFQLWINMSKCEKDYFSSGKTPTCIVTTGAVEVYPAISENDLQNFISAYEKSKKNVGCDLKTDFYKDVNILLKRDSGLTRN